MIGPDNGLSPRRQQDIIWTNAEIVLFRTLGANFSDILSKIHTFSFKKLHLEMSATVGYFEVIASTPYFRYIL